MLIEKTAFYQNDNYVRAQAQANNEATGVGMNCWTTKMAQIIFPSGL